MSTTQYAQRLDALTQKRYLSEDEKMEEVRLKKLKLRLKDQMESIEREHRLAIRRQRSLIPHCQASGGPPALGAIYPRSALPSAFFYLYLRLFC